MLQRSGAWVGGSWCTKLTVPGWGAAGAQSSRCLGGGQLVHKAHKYINMSVVIEQSHLIVLLMCRDSYNYQYLYFLPAQITIGVS